eukprot:470550-Hanusia_phi.AAC.7
MAACSLGGSEESRGELIVTDLPALNPHPAVEPIDVGGGGIEIEHRVGDLRNSPTPYYRSFREGLCREVVVRTLAIVVKLIATLDEEAAGAAGSGYGQLRTERR